MRVGTTLREQVRRRADFACEYCGATETDTGGKLTIDHYRPQAQNGPDIPDNLLYSCHRCNQYKADYWPQSPDDPPLWNPRLELATTHFLELADGTLHPITATGAFTVSRLRLNRPPLVAHRLQKRIRTQEQRLIAQYRDILALLEQLSEQQAALLHENNTLLEEQRLLLRLLVEQRG